MLQGGAEEYAVTAPWIAVFPGLAIMVAVFGINIFGDALRDVLDPKLRNMTSPSSNRGSAGLRAS